jgi:hypothetical protein
MVVQPTRCCHTKLRSPAFVGDLRLTGQRAHAAEMRRLSGAARGWRWISGRPHQVPQNLRMRPLAVVAGAVAFSFAANMQARAPKGLKGTWKLNAAKSRFITAGRFTCLDAARGTSSPGCPDPEWPPASLCLESPLQRRSEWREPARSVVRLVRPYAILLLDPAAGRGRLPQVCR